MSALPALDDALASSIVELLHQALPGAEQFVLSGLAPMFGGNARKAWSFDLAYVRNGQTEQLPCVMLSHGASRQLDTDVEQEYRVLHALNGKGTRAPAAIAMDRDGAIVGAPSIVLQRMPGQANAVKFLNLAPETGVAMTLDLADVVADLHAVPWDAAAFDPLLQGCSARDIARGQIEHWYQTFLEQRMEPLPAMKALFGWLGENLPDPQRIRLVHGDLRPGNFLYEGNRVTALLDWEMTHLGDPVEDLGWIFRPLWSPERFVSLRDFVARYSQRAGVKIAWADVLYYRIFSELKFATISLTAARAFVTAKQPNLRHADRAATVAPCLKRCFDMIAEHRLETRRA